VLRPQKQDERGEFEEVSGYLGLLQPGIGI
jgi:hypothetical protein